MTPVVRCVLAIGLIVLVDAGLLFYAISGEEGISPLLRTILVLASAIGVLGCLSWFLRIYPQRALVWLGLAAGAASFALLGAPTAALGPVLALDAAVVVVALVDLLTLPHESSFSAERRMGKVASINQTHRVTLTISNRSVRQQPVAVRDAAAQELHAEPDEFTLRLAARSRVTVSYDIRSQRRGKFQLSGVFLRARSLLGMWQRLYTLPAESTLHVYPDMKQVAEYALLARRNRLALLGVRRTRRIGQDNEFERLRDYTPDDNFKHIDWRSTSRRRKLTVKDFQANQNQQILFLIDCGRMMTNAASGLTLLDHAFNSMLMLSYVALTHGDGVGMLAFSDEIHTFVPPKSGAKQMNRLLHASFDRFPRLVESRYDEAFLYLSRHHRKRSLVILMTNVIDEVNARQVESYLSTLVGKHLPLGILMRDRQMFSAVERHAAEAQPFRAAAAADILLWRAQLLADLSSQGVLSVDVFPEDLTAPLVNRYLEIKARHLL